MLYLGIHRSPICKILFFFGYNLFGCKNRTVNHRFRIGNMPKKNLHFKTHRKKYFEETNHESEPTGYMVRSLCLMQNNI